MLSQSPSSMDKQILLTCNTRILFALDPEDLRVVAGQLGDLPEENHKRIPRMPRGYGGNYFRTWTLCVIRSSLGYASDPITTHVAETPDLREVVEKWRKVPSEPIEELQIIETISDILQKIAGDIVGLSVRDLRLQLRARNLFVTDHRLKPYIDPASPRRQSRETLCIGAQRRGLL